MRDSNGRFMLGFAQKPEGLAILFMQNYGVLYLAYFLLTPVRIEAINY